MGASRLALTRRHLGATLALEDLPDKGSSTILPHSHRAHQSRTVTRRIPSTRMTLASTLSAFHRRRRPRRHTYALARWRDTWFLTIRGGLL